MKPIQLWELKRITEAFQAWENMDWENHGKAHMTDFDDDLIYFKMEWADKKGKTRNKEYNFERNEW